MRIDELRAFIADTRHFEGVSWYLRDDSPLDLFGVMYTLTVFDDQGQIIEQIPHIEVRLGNNVPVEQVDRIRSLREQAGINPGFVRNSRPMAGEMPQSQFEACRRHWINSPPFPRLRPLGRSD